MQNQVFSENAHDFWKINGPFKTLHDINPARIEFIDQHIRAQNLKWKNLACLDCGCGAGILSESLAMLGAKVKGIDIAKEVIEVARAHWEQNQARNKNHQLEYSVQSTDELTDEEINKYDIITCLEMLEHVNEPEKVIADLALHLKSGGLLFLSTINRNPSSFIKAIVLGEYCTNLIPKGTHHYREFIKPSELNAVCKKNGLELLALSGFSYNPITRKAKLSQDASVNYLSCYIKRG